MVISSLRFDGPGLLREIPKNTESSRSGIPNNARVMEVQFCVETNLEEVCARVLSPLLQRTPTTECPQ